MSPANEIADELGNSRVANIVMLGAYLKKTGVVKPETLIKCLEEKLGKKKAHLIPMNEEALKKGRGMRRLKGKLKKRRKPAVFLIEHI